MTAKKPRRHFRLLSPLTALVVISFVVGLIVGLKIYSDRGRAEFLNKRKSVTRILTFKNLYSKAVKLALSERTGWTYEFIEVETSLDLWQRLESSASDSNSGFDLVTLYSYQVPLAFQLGKIQAADRARIPNFNVIHPDFSDLPGDPSLQNVVPLLWRITGMAVDSNLKPAPSSWKTVFETKTLKDQVGLSRSATELLRIAPSTQNTSATLIPAPGVALRKLLDPVFSFAVLSDPGKSAASLLAARPLKVLAVSHSEMAFAPLRGNDWTFRYPDGGGTFSVLSAGVARDTKQEDAVYAFLNEMQSPAIAKALIETTHMASVNRSLEADTALDERLKPSYLRKIPIGSYVLWTDFSRAREVREIMSSADRHP